MLVKSKLRVNGSALKFNDATNQLINTIAGWDNIKDCLVEGAMEALGIRKIEPKNIWMMQEILDLTV